MRSILILFAALLTGCGIVDPKVRCESRVRENYVITIELGKPQAFVATPDSVVMDTISVCSR